MTDLHNNKGSVEVVNLSSYVRPQVEENPREDWVSYEFERHLPDNTSTQDYFDYIIDRYYGSPTNNAAINGITALIYGKGYAAVNSSRYVENWAQLVSLLPQKEVKAVTFEQYVYGVAYYLIQKTPEGTYRAYHTPTRNWRAQKCNDKGEVENYYYASDWDNVQAHKETPEKVVAYGYHNEGTKKMILCVKDYAPGNYYYSPPKYQGCLPHAEMEEEIANYHISNIINGLQPSMIINMNNGDPGEEKKARIKNEIKRKLQGSSNSGNFILSFNEGSDTAATIESAPISDAHQQYEFLSREASEKIIIGHRITSPMLLGIKNNTGLGNNADEIKTASQLFDSTVIRPLQETNIDALNVIGELNGFNFEFFFKSVQPIEFDEPEKPEAKVNLSRVELSGDEKKALFEYDTKVADALDEVGEREEDMLADYDLLTVEDVDYDNVDLYDEELQAENELYKKKNNTLLSRIIELVSTGTARPNAKSEQDGEVDGDLYKVRYEYSPKRVSPNSREFCKRMIAADKIYRKEDIMRMSSQSVNAGFGVKGAANYDIWLYKGGARCQHKWLRKIYVKKSKAKNVDVKNPNAPTVGTAEARRKGFRPEANANKVAVAPKDMKNKGFVNPPSPKDIQAGI